jgi:3-methyladenine DNA glycosylase/8-oxoguanine DNA glycosylase
MPPTPPYDFAAAVDHLRRSDPRLAEVIDRLGPCRLEIDPAVTPYAALLESIVYQQLTGKAAATIFRRLCGLFDSGRVPRARAIAEAPIERLREAGLSQAKARAVKDLAEKALARRIPGRARLAAMSDEEIIERLTEVRGVGRWTVEMLLIFTLGRPDVLPVHDYGVRKGFARAFGKRKLPAPKALARHGERWRPYRTVASWYLWRVLDGPADWASREGSS